MPHLCPCRQLGHVSHALFSFFTEVVAAAHGPGSLACVRASAQLQHLTLCGTYDS